MIKTEILKLYCPSLPAWAGLEHQGTASCNLTLTPALRKTGSQRKNILVDLNVNLDFDHPAAFPKQNKILCI